MTLDCTKINLKKGSKGETVKEIQKILQTKGYYKYKIDGQYGTETEKAVKQLQKQQGNSQDGVFGPKTCKKYNESIAKKQETTTNKSKLWQRFEKATKTTITDYKTLYKAFGKVKYVLYYNDIYTLEQEISRVEQGKALNCTDQAQLAMNLLKDIYKDKKDKISVRIVRGVVTCKSGKGFGHVWLQINTGNGWSNYDPSATSAHGYTIGKLICNIDYKITNINPSWATSDDGKT